MASPFSFPKGPSFGGGDTTSRPKSPKVTAVENPYLKIVAMGGGASGPSGGASQSMSMSRGFQTPQYQYNMTRDPLVSLQGGGGLGTQQTAHAKRPKPTSSLPPPNMSLSLMEGTLPMPMNTPKQTQNEPFEHSSNMAGTVPAPVSPPMLTTAMAPAYSSADDNWVVGYGFQATSMSQVQELMTYLEASGMIDKRISGGNWVAVHYLSPFAAEKATGSQPIYSPQSNIYFGISRVTPERLRILEQHQSKVAVSTYNSNENQPLLAITEGAHKPMEECDILLRHVDTMRDTDRPTKPENVCEQVMAWWFGWNYSTSITPPTPSTPGASSRPKLE